MLVVATARATQPTTAEQRSAKSATEIHALRATINEPPEIAAEPWLQFIEARGRRFCDPGVLVTLEALGRDCKVEAGKIIPALMRTATVVLVPGFDSRILFEGRPSTAEEKYKDDVKKLNDVATVVGTPMSAINCLAKGIVRASAGEHPGTDDLLAGIDGATDLYQLQGMLRAGAGGLKTLSSAPAGSGAAKRLGDLGKEIGEGVAGDPLGAVDTGLGPTQASGWFERIHKAWRSTNLGRWSAVQSAADEAREKFEACDVDGALAAQEKVLPLVRSWARGWRHGIELYEDHKYCADTGWAAMLGLEGRASHDLELEVDQYRTELADLQSRKVLDPDWAEPSSIEARRALVRDINETLRSPGRLITEALAGDCDLGPALATIRKIEANNACFESLVDEPSRRRLAEVRERIRAIQLAIPDLRSAVAQAASEAASRIDACAMTGWSEPLDQAIAEFDRLHGPQITAGQLQVCLPEGLDRDALRERSRAREESLARLTREARELKEQAGRLDEECRFDEAEQALSEAAGKLDETGCPLAQADCEGATYEPVRCSLIIVRDGLEAARAALDQRRQAYNEADQQLQQQATELQTQGEGELETARGTSPDRCRAIDQVRVIAGKLEALTQPLGCPGENRWAEEGAELRRLLDEAVAAFDQQLEAAVKTGDDAAEACDMAALQAAIDQFVPLEQAACPARTDQTARLRKRLSDIDDEAAEARRILKEGQKDWQVWMQSCDTSMLATTEARESNLPRCGYANLTPDEQSAVNELMWWGDNAPRLAALARSADPHLAAAEKSIESARRKLDAGVASEADRQAMAADLDAAVAALDGARRAASAMREGELISAACSKQVMERIAELEGAMPSLPPPEGGTEADATTPPTTSGTAAAGTSGAPSGSLTVTVPNLVGQADTVAVAWLEELGLSAVLRTGSPASEDSEQGKVERQEPAANTSVAAAAAVSLWIRGPAPAPEPSVPVTQATCDSTWPGTVLTQPVPGGPVSCLCPNGTTWSKVRGACLSLSTGGVAQRSAAVDCSTMPGTLYDPAAGLCRCPVGRWDVNQRRCVDTAAAERERRIADLQHAGQCERLYADIEVFSSHGDAAYRQMGAAAQQQARAMGCDSVRIAAAVAASGRFGTPTSRPSGGQAGAGVPAGGSGGSAGTTGPAGVGSSGGRCVIMDISYASAGGSVYAYLAYQNPSTSPGSAPDAYGVLTVPTSLKSGGRSCSSARSCLAMVAGSNPFQILGEYSSRAAASAVARQRCPNPVHTSSY